MMFAHGETVTRLRDSLVASPYSGDESAADEDFPASLDIPGCAIADGGSIEPLTDARNSVESDIDVIAPAGTNIWPTDRLRVRGVVCQVVGQPFDWRSPFTGWEPGVVIKCKVVEDSWQARD